MNLGKNEEAVRTWEYGTSQVKGVNIAHSLTVTNKRIIAEENSTRRISRQEIGVDSVKGLSITHEVGSKALAIFLMVLGVIFAVGAIILMVSDELDGSLGLILGGVLFLIGFILFIVGVFKLNQGDLSLIITTKGVEGESLTLGISNLRRKRLKGGKVKVAINNEVAQDIVETLGATIFGN